MKSCPQCGRSYPDSDTFCETDGAMLVAGGAARAGGTAPSHPGGGAGGAIECPTCGGRAEPGEVICNYCGSRLVAEGESSAAAPGAAQTGGAEPVRPAAGRTGPREFGDESAYAQSPVEDEGESSAGRRLAGVLGYTIAAIVALAAGIWLAIHLSGHHGEAPTTAPVAQASPSPALQAPSLTLARNLQVTVKGADLAGALQRDPASARTVFDANHDALLDTYKHALESDGGLRDGMVVRLHVMPDGGVAGGAVIVSTTPNPSLDAEVVTAMSGWKFPAVTGGATDVDYPLIFASGPGDIGALEADLGTRMGARAPGEMPEYAISPSPSPSVASATPAPVAPAPPPAALATPPAPSPGELKREHRRRERIAAAPPPARPAVPPLSDRVSEALRHDRRFGRVRAYASPGGLVTLTGTVFDGTAKSAAERKARTVSGVTSVVNNLTTETSQWAANQAAIQAALQTAGLTGVTARVIGRACYLDGTVKTDLERQRAVTVAMGAAPVKVESNLIRVDPGFFGF